MTAKATILTLLSALAACDASQKREFRHERKDGRYQTAMAEYRAGRLDNAVKEFQRLVKDDPANASARFQLACLLQDSRRDYAGAYCNYREYLAQHPDSERSKLARERMGICEREMAREFAVKYGIVSGEAHAKEIAEINGKLLAAERRCAETEKRLSEATAKAANLEDDRKRLLQAVRKETDTETDLEAPSLKSARKLLDDDEEDTDRIVLSKDVAALKAQGNLELKAAEKGPSILPEQPKDAKAKRDSARKAAAERKSRGDRPERYTVEDGDTLYKIAERFYGRTSAWVEIRNANKAIISVDGRVKAGDRIVLP